jgi:hypothetical protein
MPGQVSFLAACRETGFRACPGVHTIESVTFHALDDSFFHFSVYCFANLARVHSLSPLVPLFLTGHADLPGAAMS